MRIFCAVELPDDVRASVAAHISRLREAAGSSSSSSASPLKAGWERAEKLHLTLKFLGELERARVEALTRAAERAAEGVDKFELTLEETGAFPASGNPRVLWLGLRDDTRQLAALQERLEKECARENFPREARAFHPHITIARIRIPNAAARRLAKLHSETKFEAARFSVNEFVVMQSELGTAVGSRYTPLSRHALKAAAEA